MDHTILIILHASFATAAFVLGLIVATRIPTSIRSRRFAAYYAGVFVAVGLLASVVILDWGGLPLAKRVAFSVLGLLALYMLLRTEQARRSLARQGDGWRKFFVGHVGFVLISLFDGFCIVSAIDLQLAPWLIAIVAVLGVAIGVLWIRRRTSTVTAGGR